MTKRVGFAMRINEGAADEYRRRHDAIWPELRAALLEAGVLDYRIYLGPDGRTLFAALEHEGAKGLEDLRRSDLMRRWWEMMADIMETNDDKSPREDELTPMFALSKSWGEGPLHAKPPA